MTLPRRSPGLPPPELPPQVDPHDPRTLRWRVDHLEHRVSALEHQPTMQEQIGRLPWERLLLALALLVAAKLGWISSDVASGLLGR